MLPSDLNKFKEYLDSRTNYNYEDMGKLLNILNDNSTRSSFVISLTKLGYITKDNKPTVEVKECITPKSKYIEEKIIITSYYEDHVQHNLLGNCINKLKKNNNTDLLVFTDEYKPPHSNVSGNNNGTKISG